MAAAVIGFAGNEPVARYRITVVGGSGRRHETAADAEHQLVHAIPRLAGATLHTDPVRQPAMAVDHFVGRSRRLGLRRRLRDRVQAVVFAYDTGLARRGTSR